MRNLTRHLGRHVCGRVEVSRLTSKTAARGSIVDQKAPAPRTEVNCPAWIDFGDGSPLLKCTAVNLSRTGAKLAVSARTALPQEFVLRFTPNGDIAMVCKIVWAREGTVGLRFIARAGNGAEQQG